MKLYTEEQVREMINDVGGGFVWYYDIIKKHTPIELPSDEEIEEDLFHQSNEYAYGYKDAFKWMREQILKNK